LYKIKGDISGKGNACSLNYEVSLISPLKSNKKFKELILNSISCSFNEIYNLYNCGACRLHELDKIGIYGVKIAGRDFSAAKKNKDAQFIKSVLLHLGEKNFPEYVKDRFKQIYKRDCNSICYYPKNT
jgi:hypothetical protein